MTNPKQPTKGMLAALAATTVVDLTGVELDYGTVRLLLDGVDDGNRETARKILIERFGAVSRGHLPDADEVTVGSKKFDRIQLFMPVGFEMPAPSIGKKWAAKRGRNGDVVLRLVTRVRPEA